MNAAGKSRRDASRSEHRHVAVKRRREQALADERARHRQARRRVRRRRIVAGMGIVVALALVAFATVLVVHERNKPDLALRARSVAGHAPEQTIAKVPVAYRVNYRVETQTKAQPLIENLTVRRPFEMRYRIADEGKLDTPLYDLIVTKTDRTERSTGEPDAASGRRPCCLPTERGSTPRCATWSTTVSSPVASDASCSAATAPSTARGPRSKEARSRSRPRPDMSISASPMTASSSRRSR